MLQPAIKTVPLPTTVIETNDVKACKRRSVTTLSVKQAICAALDAGTHVDLAIMRVLRHQVS